MSWSTTNKYLFLFRTAAFQELRSRSALVARMAFFIVTLLIFSNLWRVAFESGFDLSLNAADMLWYLVVTEVVLLSVPRLYKELELEIKNGEIISWLTRPLIYPLASLARASGTFIVRVFFIALIGSGFAAMFSGKVPISWPAFCWLLLLVPLAGLVLMVFEASIGLLTIWLHEVEPLFWIWQKFLFILGGLMLPISIYPEWLQSIAAWTPFYAALYGCGRLVLESSQLTALTTLVQLLIWLIVGIIVLSLLFRKTMNSIALNGG